MQNILSLDPTQFLQILQSFGSSLSLEVLLKILVSALLVIWFAVAVWVIKDITTRTTSILVQSLSILLIVLCTPILGFPLYLLIRPRSTLFEKHYEETWLENFEHEKVHLVECSGCQKEIDTDAKFCPHCGLKQFEACSECGEKMLLTWKYCTSCGTTKEDMKKDDSKKTKPHLAPQEKPLEEPKKEEIMPEKSTDGKLEETGE